MNHIKKLQADNKMLRGVVEDTINRLTDLQAYYLLQKFQGVENDYAHVSTDVMPRITELKDFVFKSTAII